MKLINKEGMVFEKINIVDLLVILFVIAIVGLGVYKVSKDKGPVFVNQTKHFEMDFVLRSMYDGFQEEINVGDKLYDDKSGAYLGTIISKEASPALREVETADGTIVNSEVPSRWDINFTIEGNGTYNNKGLNVGGEVRYVGLFFRMRTASFLVDGAIIDIRVDGE